MKVTITEKGMVKVVKMHDTVVSGGKAFNGTIASWGSRLHYAPKVEKVWRRGSGGARMFERGVAETLPMIEPTMRDAIPRGAAAVGQAKRKIRDKGVENIRRLTPVRTGRLQRSVQEMSRPIGIPEPPL